nr:hypothetical protein [Elusimicrobiota bacterium]
DAAYAGSLSQLSANWTAAADAESGIAKYWYAIGTTVGGTDVAGWTDNGAVLSVTKAGLTLVDGTTYYFSVKAENGSGLQSGSVNSDGQMTDATAPAVPGTVNDGTGADIGYTTSGSQLAANWTASSDAQSGIARYWYAIGTTVGGIDVAGWTDNGAGLSVTRAGLALVDGTTYYFSVKAENGSGLQSGAVNSNGQMADASAPSVPGAVNDGIGADIGYTTSGTQLSANWTAAADAQSGVAKYWYAIGTTVGGTEVLGWTDNGVGLSVTRTGLTLTDGTTYYFSVKAENGSGLQSGAVNSNGQTVDTTAPGAPGAVNDGTGVDIAYTASATLLQANWTAAADAESGIARYWYAIGTTVGGTDVAGWTDNGAVLSVTRTGLTLTNGQVYYFTVKAENNAGLQSGAVNSNGQTVDTTAPGNISVVNDGSGADIAYAADATQLQANWTASADAESGIARYWYAIGTAAGGTDVVGWTDNGAGTSVTKIGLSLTDGAMYYFSVKAENGSGLKSAAASSNGQRVDASAPGAPGTVNDGAGADIGYTASGTQLSANWTAAADAQSGIVKYWYAIGTTAGSTDVAGWTDNGINTSVTKTGLTLTNGQVYYFTVKAENGVGLQSAAANSNGQTADTTAPGAPGAVNDGTGADAAYAGSLSQLSANWTAAADAESGIAKYWYAIGTTVGGTDVVGWTDNSIGRSVISTGLSLTDGQVYYFTVKAENNAGLQSGAVNSDGQLVDATPPAPVTYVHDGLGADESCSTSIDTLSANWDLSSDAQSGISRYWYAIGTTAGAVDLVDWTDNGVSTSVSRSGLSLVDGTTYYFSVKAGNNAGLQSSVLSSDGQLMDSVRAQFISEVRDGTGADIDYYASLSSLSANWAASSHPRGINRYMYAVGTAPGTTDLVPWTSNGLSTSVTLPGLGLAEGTAYYFCVMAYPNSGLPSYFSCSDGQVPDVTSPSAVIQVTSPLPAPSGPLTFNLTINEANPLPSPPRLYVDFPGGIRKEAQLSHVSGSAWTGEFFIEPSYSTGTVSFSLVSPDAAGNPLSAILSGSTFYMDTTVSALSGGVVVDSGIVTVIVPPGAVPVATLIISTTVPASRTASAAGGDSLAFTGLKLEREFSARALSGGAISSFNVPVKVKMFYPDADNNGIVDGTNVNEGLVGLYWLNEALGRWVLVSEGVTRDPALNSVQAEVAHFSIYSLRYVDSEVLGNDHVKVYPNPCRMDRGPMKISNIHPGATGVRIYIYDVSGALVRVLDRSNGVDSMNVGTWDGRVSSGGKAASGVYLYVVRTSNMGSAAGKMAVIW